MDPLLMGDHLRQLKSGRCRPARNGWLGALAIAMAVALTALALASGRQATGDGPPLLPEFASKEIVE